MQYKTRLCEILYIYIYLSVFQLRLKPLVVEICSVSMTLRVFVSRFVCHAINLEMQHLSGNLEIPLIRSKIQLERLII